MDITVVFFDIDGTLLETKGAGRYAFEKAIATTVQQTIDISHISFAGATDLDLFRKILSKEGLKSTTALETEFFRALAHELDQAMEGRNITVFPGVRELLDVLIANRQVLVGLVTGNIDEGARIKLGHAGLHGHFMLGAFGCEHADRLEIARLALKRAEQNLLPDQHIVRKVLIGDTPSDIAAAKAIDAVAIAVATGRYSSEDLQAAGADHTLQDLNNLPELLNLILGY